MMCLDIHFKMQPNFILCLFFHVHELSTLFDILWNTLWLETATPVEINCPVGTIRATEGGANISVDCVPCGAGSYCLEGSSAISGKCLQGFYCPTAFPNPFGTEPPTIGSYGSQQVCVDRRISVSKSVTNIRCFLKYLSMFIIWTTFFFKIGEISWQYFQGHFCNLK